MEEELGGVLPYLIIKSPMKPPLTSECVISVSHLLKEVIDVDKLKGWVNDAFDPDIKEFVRLTEQMGEPHSNVHFSAEFEMAKLDKAGYNPIFFLLLSISTSLMRPYHLSTIKASIAIKKT